MENLAKLTDYKSAPTATIQKAGSRNKKMYKKNKRGGAYATDDNYDKTLDQLERGNVISEDSYAIDMPGSAVFADDDEYANFDDLPGNLKAGGSRKRKHRTNNKSKKNSKKRTHKRRKSGKRGRKSRR
jgi:hypothetical protein